MENPTPPIVPVLAYDRYDASKDRRGFLRIILGFWLGIIIACPFTITIYFALTYFAPQLIRYDLFDVMANILVTTILAPLFCMLTLPFALYLQRRIKLEVRFASLFQAMFWGLVYALPLPYIRFLNLLDHLPLWLAITLYISWLLLFPILPSFWLCYRSHLRD